MVGRAMTTIEQPTKKMAEEKMLAMIEQERVEAARKAAYVASEEYKQQELTAMRAELNKVVQAFEKARADADAESKSKKSIMTQVHFGLEKKTPQRAINLFKTQYSAYNVDVRNLDYWDDFGYHVTGYEITVALPFVDLWSSDAVKKTTT